MKWVLLFVLMFTGHRMSNTSQDENEKVVMIVNLLRHGARTPSKHRPEYDKYFDKMVPGKLTHNGFRQMVLLGKAIRKLYVESKLVSFNNFIDSDKVEEQFLLMSSPSPRAIESALGYSLGLFPEYSPKVHDRSNPLYDHDPAPPLLKSKLEELLSVSNKTYNMIVEQKDKDVLFHSRRCGFPEHIYNPINHKRHISADNRIVSNEERKLLHSFLSIHFNITLKDTTHNDLSDKLARSLYTGVRCINAQTNGKIHLPKPVKVILKKLFTHYLFMKRTDHEEITKITSSPFLDHLLQFFDHKVNNITERLDFYELGRFNYRNLRLVSYSGHDYNFVGLIKNLIHLETISHYIENIEIYEKLILIPFASTIDFVLVKYSKEYYVKIFLNGEEIFEKIRSHKLNEEIIYEKGRGIPYETFRKIIDGRIFKDYHHCIHTKK
jgi:hypothetical protein